MERIHHLPRDFTPEFFLQENRSSEANIWRNEWYEAKRRRQLTAVDACGDPRLWLTHFVGHNIANITSISAAANTSHFQHLFKHEGIGQTLVLGHFDCGGTHVRAALDRRPAIVRLAENYVASHLRSSDPVIQTYRSAKNAARITNKPVLAAVMDHDTGIIYPIAEITDKGREIKTAFDKHDLEKGSVRYDRDRNMPRIVQEDLLEPFSQLIDHNIHQVAQMMRSPNFKAGQRINNPLLALISTGLIPAALRYPSLDAPNAVFSIELAYRKVGHNNMEIDSGAMKDVMEQIEYPIGNAADSKTGGAFSELTTLLIETPDIRLSRSVAQRLVTDPMMNKVIIKWIQRMNGRILVGEIHKGQTARVEYFNE